MYKRRIISFLGITVSFLSVFVFQNCGQPFAARLPSSVESETSASEGKAMCTNLDDVGPSPQRRMAKHQLVNTLTDLFGTTVMQNSSVVSAVSLIPDDGGARNNRHVSNDITSEHIETYVDAGFEVAQAVFANSAAKTAVFGSCASATTILATCLDSYLANFAARIMRRPLSAAEITSAKSLYSKSTDPKEGLVNVLAMHLSAPSFLVLVEVGTDADTQTFFQISDYEIATRLSYALTDSTPDVTLMNNAKNGQLKNDSVLKSEARRLAQTPNGRYKIRQMFHDWLEVQEYFDYSSLGTSFLQGVNTTGLDSAAVAEMDQFIDHVVFTLNGSYIDLVTSKASFAQHAGLAAIHGHAPISNGVPVNMTTGRQGIMGRVPYLFSGTTRSNIILRGVAFRRNVLCQSLPSPPADIINSRQMTDLTPAQILSLSNRDWTSHRTSDVTCLGCHSLINPAGFTFEMYDSIGRLRNQENIYDGSFNFVGTQPIDSTADVPWGQKTIRASNANDLTLQVAASLSGQACLGKTIYEYTHNRLADNRDGCQLNETSAPLQTAGGSILDSFISSTVNRGIRWKRTQ